MRTGQREVQMAMRQTGSMGLEATEVAVIHAASRIFAAMLAGGRHTTSNHANLIRSAVSMALELARETEKQVHGEPELDAGPGGDGDVLDLLD
jgi:hypothetical protein